MSAPNIVQGMELNVTVNGNLEGRGEQQQVQRQELGMALVMSLVAKQELERAADEFLRLHGYATDGRVFVAVEAGQCEFERDIV